MRIPWWIGLLYALVLGTALAGIFIEATITSIAGMTGLISASAIGAIIAGAGSLSAVRKGKSSAAIGLGILTALLSLLPGLAVAFVVVGPGAQLS